LKMLINTSNFFSKRIKIGFKRAHLFGWNQNVLQNYPFPSDKSRIKSVFVTPGSTSMPGSVTKSHFSDVVQSLKNAAHQLEC
jgi:hypothetical protein